MEYLLTLQVQYLKNRTYLTLDGSLVACQTQNAKKVFLKKKLKRMSLLIVVCETSMRASFALNMYEITHEVSLVLAF